jgi:cardiolipin synthase A/B
MPDSGGCLKEFRFVRSSQFENPPQSNSLGGMQTESGPACQWLCTGDEIFAVMLAAIDAAQKSVCLEIYAFHESPLGIRFRDALVRARGRGARVRVLADAVGSFSLRNNFWTPLRNAGGEVKQFNPVGWSRLMIRNHRKLLVCDGHLAFIGGFNISPEYEGDGVTSGWCDVGMKIEGGLVKQLASSFEEMFARAEFKHKRFVRLRRTRAKKTVALPKERIFFTGPGLGWNPFMRALREDLRRAKDVQIIVAYFLPPWRLRRALMRAARRGAKVRLILPAKSDVQLSMLAAQSLYRRFLKSRIGIYEYQPQILHAKMIIVDDVVYVGSSNLDPRSLHINYELMIRFENKKMTDEARAIFSKNLEHSRRMTKSEWRKSRTVWRKLKQRWAYFLLNRIDPYVARRQWRTLPD